jgi:hypothetical protein
MGAVDRLTVTTANAAQKRALYVELEARDCHSIEQVGAFGLALDFDRDEEQDIEILSAVVGLLIGTAYPFTVERDAPPLTDEQTATGKRVHITAGIWAGLAGEIEGFDGNLAIVRPFGAQEYTYLMPSEYSIFAIDEVV